MKTVIVISEECHGIIGYAYDVYSAVMFLLGDHWIGEDTPTDNEKTVKERFGYTWDITLKHMKREEFNDVFCDSFYLSKEEVIWFYVKEN